MTESSNLIEVVRDISRPAAWCEEKGEILFSRWSKANNRMEPVTFQRNAFGKALDALPDNLRASPGFLLMKDVLDHMNNQELAQFVDSMSISDAPRFQLSEAHKRTVGQWYDARNGAAPEEGVGSVREKYESGITRRIFIRGTVRYGLGALAAIFAADAVTGIPRGDEPEKLEKTAAGAAASSGAVAIGEMLHTQLDAKEQLHYYATQTVKFLNGKAREYLLDSHPNLASQASASAQR